MQWRKVIKQALLYHPPTREPFILPEGTWFQEAERGGILPTGTVKPEGADTTSEYQPPPSSAETAERPLTPPERRMRKPVPLKEVLAEENDGKITPNLAANRLVLSRLFHKPDNIDLVLRDFALPPPAQAGLLVYIDGIVDSNRLNYSVLQPLMVFAKHRDELHQPVNIDVIQEHLMPIHQVDVVESWDNAVQNLVDGLALIFVEGDARAVAVESRNFPSRSVSKPEVETIVRGPQEAFTESKRVNVALVRKHLRDQDLVTESVNLGEGNSAFYLYIKGTANPMLVDEVRRRLTQIKGDFLREPGLVEQMIEEFPNSLYPQSIATERPDRVAFSLIEGRVAVIFEGSPFALIMPATLFTLMQTPEDYYLRPAFGTLLRLVRVAAIFIAYLLPGLYLAVVLHHHAIIPPDLLLAMAGAREGVPFPSWLEVLLMEISFEVIREAGIRVPGVIGPTLGIVGAIVLGQAAVSAAIVSPILIIIVAVTALASFAVPNYALQFSTRIIRFAYIIAGYALGLYGIVLGLAFQIFYTAGLTSFGIGYLSPVAPATKRDKDVVVRSSLWKSESRPDYLQPVKREQQPHISRKWTEEKGNGEK